MNVVCEKATIPHVIRSVTDVLKRRIRDSMLVPKLEGTSYQMKVAELEVACIGFMPLIPEHLNIIAERV